MEKHKSKFKYLGYRESFSEGYSISFFKERLKEALAEKESQKSFKIKFSKGQQLWIEAAKEYVYFRNYRGERLYEALYYLEPLWKKIALVYGLGENDLGYYLLEEAEFLFSKNKKVKDSEIEKRKKGFGLLLHDDKLALITGKALDKKKYLLNEESDGDFIFTQALSIK